MAFIEADHVIAIPWLVIHTIGQVLLIFLFFTLVFGKDIPHRRNLYLLSLVLGNTMATIPPSLMLYTGHVFADKVPNNLCIAQSVMVDTVPVILFLVLIFLALDNLAELCHLCFRTRHFTRQVTVYSVLVILPYFIIAIFTVWSSVGALITDDDLVHRNTTYGWVWCRTNNPEARHVIQPAMKYTILVLNILTIFIELGVLGLIYLFPLKKETDAKIWRTTSSFSLRVLILFAIQLLTVILIAVPAPVESPIRFTFEMLESTQGVLVFLVFATQKVIFHKWALWAAHIWNKVRRKPKEDPYAPQPFGLPNYSFPDYTREASPWESSAWDEESVMSAEKCPTRRFRKVFKIPSFKVQLRLPRWQLRRTTSSGDPNG